MFSRKTRRKSDRRNRNIDTENSNLNSGSSSNTSTTSNSQVVDTDDVHGKKSKSKMFTITGDRSPLWTTLTHAQTITEFAES